MLRVTVKFGFVVAALLAAVFGGDFSPLGMTWDD
jgi:hypothetical protein